LSRWFSFANAAGSLRTLQLPARFTDCVGYIPVRFCWQPRFPTECRRNYLLNLLLRRLEIDPIIHASYTGAFIPANRNR
jgi:hypothetical protein